jgi:hypothetical protein
MRPASIKPWLAHGFSQTESRGRSLIKLMNHLLDSRGRRDTVPLRNQLKASQQGQPLVYERVYVTPEERQYHPRELNIQFSVVFNHSLPQGSGGLIQANTSQQSKHVPLTSTLCTASFVVPPRFSAINAHDFDDASFLPISQEAWHASHHYQVEMCTPDFASRATKFFSNPKDLKLPISPY